MAAMNSIHTTSPQHGTLKGTYRGAPLVHWNYSETKNK